MNYINVLLGQGFVSHCTDNPYSHHTWRWIPGLQIVYKTDTLLPLRRTLPRHESGQNSRKLFGYTSEIIVNCQIWNIRILAHLARTMKIFGADLAEGTYRGVHQTTARILEEKEDIRQSSP